MKKLLAALGLLLATPALAVTTYYLDPNTTNTTLNGSQSTPWKTMAQANAGLPLNQNDDIRLLVKPGTVTTFPAPAAGFNVGHRYSVLAADANWAIDRSTISNHVISAATATMSTSYLTVAGFTMQYLMQINTGATHDTLADCTVNGSLTIYDADTLCIVRSTICNVTGQFSVMHAGSAVGKTRLNGLVVSDCTFPHVYRFADADAAWTWGTEFTPDSMAYVVGAIVRNCTIDVTCGNPNGSTTTPVEAFRFYACPSLLLDGNHIYVHQNVCCAGSEPTGIFAFRDSSWSVTVNRDTIMADGLYPQTWWMDHGGGSNRPPRYLTIDSSYISNTAGDLLLWKTYGMNNFTMTHTTLVAKNGKAMMLQQGQCHTDSLVTGPNNIDHNTIVGWLPDGGTNLGWAIIQFSSGCDHGFYVDTTKFYSNIVINQNPNVGQVKSLLRDSGGQLTLLFMDKNMDSNGWLHTGFNIYYTTSYCNAPGDRDRQFLNYGQGFGYAPGGTVSTPGQLTTGPNANNWMLTFSVPNYIYGDEWSRHVNPRLATSDSIFTSKLSAIPYYFNAIPPADSPAIGWGQGGTTAGAALCQRYAIPSVDYPDNKSVSTDQYTVLYGIPWNAGLGTTYSDSLVVSNTDSLDSDGRHTPTLVYNISLQGANAGETMTFEPSVVRLSYGQSAHVKITWNSAYPAAAPATDYILLTPADPGTPSKAISLDFGAGHPVF